MAIMLMHKVVPLVAITMLVMVASPPQAAEAAISCGQVMQDLIPCLGYVQGGGVGDVPPTCCSGIRELNNAAKATPDRQSVCSCLKGLAQDYPGYAGSVANIPGKCGVRIPYKIDPSIDCSKVK